MQGRQNVRGASFNICVRAGQGGGGGGLVARELLNILGNSDFLGKRELWANFCSCFMR